MMPKNRRAIRPKPRKTKMARTRTHERGERASRRDGEKTMIPPRLLAFSPSRLVERAIAVAMTKLGAPYVWATAGPDTFDCSGFTWWIACQVLGPQDHELRSSHHQFNVWGDEGGGVAGWQGGGYVLPATPRPRDPATPVAGDLVFFNTTGAVVFGNLASHVGLMIDDQRFIHAANEQLGVRIDNLHGGWYDGKLIGSGRIFSGGGGVAGSQGGGEGDPARAGTTVPATLPPRYPATLVVPAGPIRTPMPWNGRPPGADWSNYRPLGGGARGGSGRTPARCAAPGCRDGFGDAGHPRARRAGHRSLGSPPRRWSQRRTDAGQALGLAIPRARPPMPTTRPATSVWVWRCWPT